MKKYFLTLFGVACICLAFQYKAGPDAYRYIENDSFGPGEVLKYRVHYGLINAAEAVMKVHDTHYDVHGRPCYKIDVFGNTTGLADVLYSVRDNWGAYIDTASILPLRSYRYIEEGKYRKNEMVDFDHVNDVATVLKLDKKTRKIKAKEMFTVPDNVLDIVGGYYFLRTLDYKNYKVGETIELEGFFADEVYKIKIKIIGKELLNTKIGDINSIIVAPILPENSFFEDGNDPVQVWISDDRNKVPLKVKAKLAIGAIEVDIKEIENLRN
ncbi:MAG: DUF3108 domain-containing protein [Cyclobacteriaceae bacterium]